MTAGGIVGLVYVAVGLVAWRVAFRTLWAEGGWDWVACAFASFFMAMVWPLIALLGSWRGWRLK